MSATIELYNSFRQCLADGTIDLKNGSVYLALLASTYSKNLNTHHVWGDVSAYEVSNGNGYTSGGAALANKAVTYASAVAKWDADDVTWASLTKTFQYGVLYVNATVNGVVKPLIALVTFGASPIVYSALDFTAIWNGAGILNWT